MNDADGFRLEAAEQFGFEHNDGQDGPGQPGYFCTESELIAFAKACERAGMYQAHGMGSRDLVAKRIAEIDAELAPTLNGKKNIESSSFVRLHQRAIIAAEAFENAASYEETMWTGWGDQIVPPYAEMRRVKAQQAVCALRDAQKVKITPCS